MDLEIPDFIEQDEKEDPTRMAKEAQPGIREEQSPSNIVIGVSSRKIRTSEMNKRITTSMRFLF